MTSACLAPLASLKARRHAVDARLVPREERRNVLIRIAQLVFVLAGAAAGVRLVDDLRAVATWRRRRGTGP